MMTVDEIGIFGNQRCCLFDQSNRSATDVGKFRIACKLRQAFDSLLK
jgi:hypothetical protein